MAQKTIDNVGALTTPRAMMQAIDDNFDELYAGAEPVTLDTSATDGGISITGQELSFQPGSNSQPGYVTAAQVTAIEANTAKESRTLDLIPTDGNTTHSVSSDGVFDALAGKSDTHTHPYLADSTTTISAQQSSDITDNNAKETNATHTGEVTGDEELTISNGVVGQVNLDSETSEMLGSFSGLAFDKPSLSVVDDGGLQLDIAEIVGGGDMKFFINGVVSTLDCTAGGGVAGDARVALTPGASAQSPTTNYIYITDTAGVATLVSSTSMPAGAFAWIGKIMVPDATTWGITGAYLIQRYTEAFQNDSRGTQSHVREKLRALGAIYIQGVSQTLNITTQGAAPDNVHLATGAGSVYQLHRQTFPSFTTGPYFLGNGLTPYVKINDLNEALETIDGTSLSGESFNLVIWGAVNLSTGDCKLYVNLPNGSYGRAVNAIPDKDNLSDYSVPDDMRSVAFLIARVCLEHGTSASGTWDELGVYSLLGTPPGHKSGSSGAVASNEFDDSQFKIYNSADPTKDIDFDVSALTSGVTRTLTMPDADVDLSLSTAHTGEVTGSEDLTVSATAVSNKTLVTAVGADHVLIIDATDGALKKALISDFASAGGDMAMATYDPTTVSGDIFDMDNMVEGDGKILTATERTNISTNKTHADSTHADSGAEVNRTLDASPTDGNTANSANSRIECVSPVARI